MGDSFLSIPCDLHFTSPRSLFLYVKKKGFFHISGPCVEGSNERAFMNTWNDKNETRDIFFNLNLLQEPSRNFWSPNSQRLITRRTISNGCLIIHQISIRIVLNHITGSIPPIIKDLRTENVSADTPNRLVAFVRQPLMSQFLCIKIMDLEGTMVNVGCGVCAHEETVVIDVLISPIDMREQRDILLVAFIFHVQEVSRHKIECCRIESDEILELLCANSEVAKLFTSLV